VELLKHVCWLGVTAFWAVSLGTGPLASGQTLQPCGAAVDDVGIEPGKPFSAERMTHSINHLAGTREERMDYSMAIWRDSEGRLRFERRPFRNAHDQDSEVSPHPGGETIAATRGELLGTILIFDCPAGNVLQLQRGTSVARIRQQFAAAPVRPGARPYSSFFNTLSTGNLPATLRFEDLGYKELQGIAAHGYRTSERGGENDGEWNGRLLRTTEIWVSDDLSATLMTMQNDFKENRESTTILTKISRQEPEAELFRVPEGFKVNRTPAERPPRTEEPPATKQKL
jgi:hypothetical protein